jgi:hypothetical protein
MTKTVYWISAAQPHRVAIVARPRGGDWLEDDIKRLSSEGIGVLVSMLTPEESVELGLSDEGKFCDQFGISFSNWFCQSQIVLCATNSKSVRP